MALIGKNIRKIRSVKKLSQQSFADLFSISRASVGSYEEGRAEPKTPLLLEIANKFDIPIRSLVEKELKVNDISGFKDENLIGSEVFAETEKKIPLVDSSYFTIKDFAAEQFITAPQTRLVDIAFKLENNALLDAEQGRLKKGDVLFAKKISMDDVDNLEMGEIYIVVTNEAVLPRYLGFTKNKLLLSAKHPFYEDVNVSFSEVKEIYSVEWLLCRT